MVEEEARKKRKQIEKERRHRESMGLDPYSGSSSIPRGSGFSRDTSSRRYGSSSPVIEKPVSKPSPKGGMSTRKGLALKPSAPKANDYMEALQQESGYTGSLQEPDLEENEVPDTLREEYVQSF